MADEGQRAGAANVTVVRRSVCGGDRDLGRPGVVDRLGAGPMALVRGGVADDPLVVDRVGVVMTNVTGRPAGTVTAAGS